MPFFFLVTFTLSHSLATTQPKEGYLLFQYGRGGEKNPDPEAAAVYVSAPRTNVVIFTTVHS